MKATIVYIKIPILIKINNRQNIRKYIKKLFKKDIFVEYEYIKESSDINIVRALLEQRNTIKTIKEIIF